MFIKVTKMRRDREKEKVRKRKKMTSKHRYICLCVYVKICQQPFCDDRIGYDSIECTQHHSQTYSFI